MLIYMNLRPVIPVLVFMAFTSTVNAEPYFSWQAEGDAINSPLGEFKGDVHRGRDIVKRKDRGNCLACHALPIKEEAFHGSVGPPLDTVATRLSEGQLRLRVVDQQSLNPYTVMPGYYRNPDKLHRVGGDYYNRTVLTAREVEDVVAYLGTLK